jgi:ABC-type nitrate/sulfonate/bicarbonate transport system ATPase subunit
MDEPFAALDAITKARLQTEFLRIWDQRKMTVVFVTHDIEEALFVSDRVILLAARPGRVAREAIVPFERPRVEELRTSPQLQELREDLLNTLRHEPGTGADVQ